MDSETVDKVIFEVMDFKFSAAYGGYSKNFDEAAEPEEKRRLNDIIKKLHDNETSYPNFYAAVNMGDSEDRRYQFRRARIETTRKRAYRKQERKTERNKRHK